MLECITQQYYTLLSITRIKLLDFFLSHICYIITDCSYTVLKVFSTCSIVLRANSN